MTLATTRPARGVLAAIESSGETWGRVIVSSLAILVQLVLFVVFVLGLAHYSGIAVGVALALDAVALVWLLNKQMPTPYKLAWAIPILLAPVVGPLFFMLFGTGLQSPRQRRRLMASADASRLALEQEQPLPLDEIPPHARRQASYLTNVGRQPPTTGSTAYYPSGEEGFEALLTGIATARKYVFCQYFMIADGAMFERLFEALAERSAAGVEVRILYDDFGSSLRRPLRLAERCRAAGMRALAVNPLGLGLTLRHNNRDHRKLCVVDGRLAYTGGVNIGDEYVNLDSPFGHWKDNVIRVEGSAAWPCAVAFLAQWRVTANEPVDLLEFRPETAQTEPAGVVIPFDDSPFDTIHLALNAYRGAIGGATRRVDILSPYLVIDDFLVQALVTAAQSGVKVRVVTPGINDGWAVGHVTRSCQRDLIRGGVEVYEYTPGFLHSKVLLADDDIAIVGTVNLDYRSFYLHYENGLWLYEAECRDAVEADVRQILDQSRQITRHEILHDSIRTRLLRAVLRVFAPLM